MSDAREFRMTGVFDCLAQLDADAFERFLVDMRNAYEEATKLRPLMEAGIVKPGPFVWVDDGEHKRTIRVVTGDRP